MKADRYEPKTDAEIVAKVNEILAEARSMHGGKVTGVFFMALNCVETPMGDSVGTSITQYGVEPVHLLSMVVKHLVRSYGLHDALQIVNESLSLGLPGCEGIFVEEAGGAVHKMLQSRQEKQASPKEQDTLPPQRPPVK